MILVADSGSTKTEWALCDKVTNNIIVYKTKGVNSVFLKKEEIMEIIENSIEPYQDKVEQVQEIYFYGAGCFPEYVSHLIESLQIFFRNAQKIQVNSDLVAAAYSLCQQDEGIACIIGTGSNSCYYDGKEIKQNIYSLGYILGDEVGSCNLGKKFLRDYLRGILPSDLRKEFINEYGNLQRDEVIQGVYKLPQPNTYMGYYSQFLTKHKTHSYVQTLFKSCFNEFLENCIYYYPLKSTIPISFVGSVAYEFQTLIQEFLNSKGLIFGKIVQSPLKGLLEYHGFEQSLQDIND